MTEIIQLTLSRREAELLLQSAIQGTIMREHPLGMMLMHQDEAGNGSLILFTIGGTPEGQLTTMPSKESMMELLDDAIEAEKMAREVQRKLLIAVYPDSPEVRAREVR